MIFLTLTEQPYIMYSLVNKVLDASLLDKLSGDLIPKDPFQLVFNVRGTVDRFEFGRSDSADRVVRCRVLHF